MLEVVVPVQFIAAVTASILISACIAAARDQRRHASDSDVTQR